MRGMILAGGLSTRLYPLTLDVPKTLVPVLNVPVVSHVIGYLSRHGVDDIVINVHYFAQAVERYIGDGSRWNVRMSYLREPQLMGSAGAVKQVEDRFEETFVVIGCDDITTIDLAAAIEFHRERKAEATIVLSEADDVTQYGVVVIDADSRIVEFQEKPAKGTERSKLVNTGVYIFEPSLLARIPTATFYDFGKQVFPGLLSAGARFFGMRQSAYWCDIGTPDEYRRVHFDVLSGRVGLTRADVAAPCEGILLGENTSVAASARLAAPACIGARCDIGSNALVEQSILWNDVVIGSAAKIKNVVLAHGSRVEPGSVIDGGEYAKESRVVQNVGQGHIKP